MFKSILHLTRRHPVNMKNEDRILFEKEFKVTIKRNSYKILSDVFIQNSKIKKFKLFRIYTNYWRMGNLKFSDRFLNFFKDLKNVNYYLVSMKTNSIKRGSWVIDSRSYQYFHFFSDCLQRIYSSKLNKENQNFLIPENYKYYDYITSTLKLLKIPHTFYKNDSLYRVDKLELIPHVAPSGNYDPKIMNKISSDLRKSIKSTSADTPRFIWVSRQAASKRTEKNFNDVKLVLKKYKFSIIEFEKLNLEKQFLIAKNAQIISGIHGAGLTNMMVMRPESHIIEGRGRKDLTNNCFFSMASALNINYHYFLCDVENNDYYGDSYNIDTHLLDEAIKNII